MLRYEHLSAGTDTGRLMDLAGACREFTGSLGALAGLPGLLAHGLGLRGVTFALVRRNGEGKGQLLACHSYPVAALAGERGEMIEEVQALLAGGCGGGAEASEGPSGSAGEEACGCGVAVAEGSRRLSIKRQVDSEHRMMLVIEPAEGSVEGAALDALHLVANHLAKGLHVMLHVQDYPSPLGEPFVRLTEREWAVLCAMDSDDGEKQLADRLGLSPHTLHSHIKAIYRKTGVQGRLPLLQRFREAMAGYRTRMLVPEAGAGETRVA